MVFEWPSKVHINMIWNTNLLRVFFWTKSLILSKANLSKTFLGQNTCNSIRNYLSSSLYNLSLSREISSSFLHTSEKGLRDRGPLVVKQSKHKGRVVLVWFITCNGFLQDSGTLKRVAWGLDVGTRVWLNQYKTEFALSLPFKSFIYCCFTLTFRLFILNHLLETHLWGNLELALKSK